jgi:osmotically-inducible protein OsmY
MVPGNRQNRADPHRDGELYRRYQTRSARSDAEIRQEVRDRLIRDERVDASLVRVAVESGLVALHGEVGTLFEKRAAGEDALDTEGVEDVSNLLRVRQLPPAGR